MLGLSAIAGAPIAALALGAVPGVPPTVPPIDPNAPIFALSTIMRDTPLAMTVSLL